MLTKRISLKFYICFLIIVYFIIINFDSTNLSLKIRKQYMPSELDIICNKTEEERKVKGIKYILQWTSGTTVPLGRLNNGRTGFLKRNCCYNNCYMTNNVSMMSVTKFDAIIFAGSLIQWYARQRSRLPRQRSPHQKYVFASMETPQRNPLQLPVLDGFFNWTWTFRLDSELRLGYFVIKEKNGTIVGPKMNMQWLTHEEMLPITDPLETILAGKNKTAAIFVKQCSLNYANNTVHQYLQKLNRILTIIYDLELDFYGDCDSIKKCSNKACREGIRQQYRFYLAFEDAIGVDYVTEQILNAVEFTAIPIVFGGANYSRFLPPNSYIDATTMSPGTLAHKIQDLSQNFDKYSNYFKWTNHYEYSSKADDITTDDICSICALLNDEEKVKKMTVYDKFVDWWNQKSSSEINMKNLDLN